MRNQIIQVEVQPVNSNIVYVTCADGSIRRIGRRFRRGDSGNIRAWLAYYEIDPAAVNCLVDSLEKHQRFALKFGVGGKWKLVVNQ